MNELTREQVEHMVPLTNMNAQTVNLGKGEGFVGVYTALALMIDTDAALRARVAELEREHDKQMERVKACEHIAEGDEGWEMLRRECPSTMAVAALRDQLMKMECFCCICKTSTDFACADCQIDLRTTVYVCAKSACRDQHETKCSGNLQRQLAESQERVQVLEEALRPLIAWAIDVTMDWSTDDDEDLQTDIAMIHIAQNALKETK